MVALRWVANVENLAAHLAKDIAIGVWGRKLFPGVGLSGSMPG